MKKIYTFLLISFFVVVASSCTASLGFFDGVWEFRHIYGTGNAWRSFIMIKSNTIKPLYPDTKNVKLTDSGTLVFSIINSNSDGSTSSLTYTGQLNVFDSSEFTPNQTGSTIRPITIRKSRFNVVDK